MASKVTSLKLVGLAVTATLISCQLQNEVSVVQLDNGQIEVEVLVKGNKTPCVTDLDIYHTSEGKVIPVWQIYLRDGHRASCISKFTYPNVPRHYSLAGNSRPLKAAEEYEVSVAGPGFIGGKEFTRIKLTSKTP
ncbi:hypothetical protein [Aquidulcibacter sp.]|uniref:hypothetical protein n=1 Tax=Aquidulcibacter sp. TaxID=2052990 RepID=UPI0025C6690C|nr:hypothetical protein [Aquidulcibacter sp.]MCA3692555.1 hypothetical protein [Aquidulcibacter sp.]